MKDKSIGSWFPLDQLKEWPDNPRIIDLNTVEAVARSIDEFGFASPIVARRENHQIICGHTRFKAAKLLKLDFVPTRFLDLNQEEANRLALADNKLGELAEWDEDILTDLLKELEVNQALDLGWSVDELTNLLEELEPEQPRSEDYDSEISDLDAIPVDVEPLTKPGDVVTMGNHTLYCKDNIEVLRSMKENSIDSIITDPPYGIDFMSKTTGWDKNVPGGEWAKECLRVLKPGGHIISFAATRTFHKLVTNLENAGFEVRDTINWLYFSGFPKSLDVSKAIDKHFGVEREVIGKRNDGSHTGSIVTTGIGSLSKIIDITKPATKEAEEAEGWGTALKPAFEPATLCRKPLSEKTVALNWLKWKTGGLNINDCRFGYGDPCWVGPQNDNLSRFNNGKENYNPTSFSLAPNERTLYNNSEEKGGRWPANIYQCPKASRGEREEGCDPTEGRRAYSGMSHNKNPTLRPKTGFEVVGRKEGSAGLNNPRAGAGRTAAEVFNIHPTVKPIKLMRWLIRLVTPRGGTVLDTFLGSGTTMIAAELEGFSSIGIEREAKYCDIIRARVKNAIDKGDS